MTSMLQLHFVLVFYYILHYGVWIRLDCRVFWVCVNSIDCPAGLP